MVVVASRKKWKRIFENSCSNEEFGNFVNNYNKFVRYTNLDPLKIKLKQEIEIVNKRLRNNE